jgi:hypothetical protein
VETQQRGEKAIDPLYDQDGKPAHRLAGLLYVTFHEVSEMFQMHEEKKVIDVPQLVKSEQLKGNILTVFQVETIFLGGIPSDKVVAVIPMVYPNLSKGFKEGYHDTIWSLTETKGESPLQHFDRAKDELSKKPIRPLYNPGITPVGKILMPAYVNLALKLSAAVASSLGKNLYYIAPDNRLEPYDLDYVRNPKFFSQVQLDLKDHLELKKGSKGKEKITPEKLNEERIHHHFSKITKQIDFDSESDKATSTESEHDA